jgi:hypothetical protein
MEFVNCGGLVVYKLHGFSCSHMRWYCQRLSSGPLPRPAGWRVAGRGHSWNKRERG